MTEGIMATRKLRQPQQEKPIANIDQFCKIIIVIDSLIDETRKMDNMTEYFLRLAKASLLEAEQKRADERGRH